MDVNSPVSPAFDSPNEDSLKELSSNVSSFRAFDLIASAFVTLLSFINLKFKLLFLIVPLLFSFGFFDPFLPFPRFTPCFGVGVSADLSNTIS